MTFDTILSIFLGVGLAASVGFRIFLPLFFLSMAAYFNVWQLNESWQWLGGGVALITFGVATLVEVFAYFIPWLDNLLDSIAVPLAAIAGTAVMVSTAVNLDPVISWALAIIAGGGTATAIKGTFATTRLASTTTTGVVETGTAAVVATASIFIPILVAFLVLILFIILFRMYRKIRPKNNPT